MTHFHILLHCFNCFSAKKYFKLFIANAMALFGIMTVKNDIHDIPRLGIYLFIYIFNQLLEFTVLRFKDKNLFSLLVQPQNNLAFLGYVRFILCQL